MNTLRFEEYRSAPEIRAAQPEHAPLGVIGVDLDGTLAFHGQHEKETGEIGPPIEKMVSRIRRWLAEGYQVKIFTGRLAMGDSKTIKRKIENWCRMHLGFVLPITDKKDPSMTEYWDDRAQQVFKNTGESVAEHFSRS
jgi:hypothetical protein